MARMWSCGFETGSIVATMEATTVSGTPTAASTGQRSGAYAMRCNTAGTPQYIQHPVKADDTAIAYVRFAIKIAAYPSASCIVHAFGDGTTWSAAGRVQTDGTYRLYNGNTAVGVASPAIPNDSTWHIIELSYDDGGGGLAVGKLDGTQFTSTTSAALGGWGQVRLGVQSGVTADIWFDDYAINDSTGSVENSFPDRAGKIVHLWPNAAGDSNGFATAVGGTAGAANNYTRVSSVPPDDLTTYNETATASTIDEFNLQSSSTAGIGASDTVKLVAVGIRSGSNATTATNTSVRLKSQASGTTTIVTGVTCNVNGTFVTNGNTVPRIYKIVSYVDPQAGGAWTPALLDTAQVGYGTPTGTTTRRVTAVWALVEYVPSSGFTVDQTDSAGLADGTEFIRSFVLTDAVGLVDSTALATARVVTDSVGLTDAAALAVSQVITDSAGLTDSSVVGVEKQVAQTDSAGLADSAAQMQAKVVTDSAGLTDTLSLAVAAVLTDSAGLTDTSLVEAGKAVTQTDSSGLTDSAAFAHSKTPTDSVGLTDAAELGTAKVQTDSAGLADTALVEAGTVLNQTDSTGLTDSASFASAKTQTDSVGLTDGAALAGSKTLTDSTGLVDTSIVEAGKVLNQTDSAGLADAQSFSLSRVLTDTVGLSDSASMTSHKAVTDSSGLVDAAFAGLLRDLAATDSAGLTDAFTSSSAAVLTDLVGLADVAALAQLRALTDSSGLVDAAFVSTVAPVPSVTPRPNTGITPRPFTTTTTRPFGGVTVRP